MADTIKLKVESATEADVFEYKKLVEEKMAAVEEKVDNIREDLDLDNFLTKEEIADYALKTELPDISVKQDKLTEAQLANLNEDHSKYLTEHQDLSSYATKEDLENVTIDTSSLVTKEEIVDYALKSELPDISVKQDVISDLEEIRLGASLGKTSIQEHQDLTGYAKLEDIPAPPDLSSYVTDTDLENALSTLDLSSKQDKLTEEQLANINEDHSKYLTEHQSLDGYAKLTDIPAPQDLSGYALKTEIPVVPENISAFNNDAGYLTEHQDLSSYALKTEIPDISVKQDKLSEIQLANINADHSKYLTEHQDLSAYALKTEIPEHVDLSGYALKSELPVVPVNVSAFNNDAGYITEHQDISGKQDVIADLAEIRAGAALGKTAIQAHQDLSAYALKTELPDISVKQDKLSEVQLANINADHSKYLTEHQSLDGYAKLEDIPAPQDLSSYALKSEIPTIPDHSIYALKTEIPDVSTKADSSNVYTKTEIDTMLGDMDTVLTALGV